MQDKIKNIIIVIGFIVILLGTFLINIIKKDELISLAERRKLASFPKVTVEWLFNGKVANDFEEYALDQFVERDFFRKIKYLFNVNILRQKDNNKLFIKNDEIYKIEYPLNETSVKKSAQKISEIYSKHLKNMNVYYGIIPDKSYYLRNEYLKMNYQKMQEIMQDNLKDMKYIDLFPELASTDYYKKDTHWKQENIRKVVSKIEREMNLKDTSKTKYYERELNDFYGVYHGQVGMPIGPDKIRYLTNDVIENCVTYNYETKNKGKIYDLEKYKTSADKYDIFLSGPTPLITIENPNANTDKELLLFRDSFGSSLAPLLVENYKKITLIDIRYMSSDLLEKYIKFEDQDVLFLYCVIVLNQNVFK